MRRFVLFVLSLSLAGCTQKPPAVEDTMASASEAFDLTPSQIRDLRLKAERGDSDAGFRLGEYYAFVKSNREEAIRWYLIPASAGNFSAMNALSLHYVGVNTEAGCKQAAEWLDKAIAHGSEKYVADGYLRQRREHLRWTGTECQH